MDAARTAWASRLGVPPSSFTRPGVLVVERDAVAAAVTVAFDLACVVIAPPALADALSRLSLDVLTDASALAAALGDSTRCDPIGTAELWFTETPPPLACAATDPATEADLDALRASCGADEWDEAGLDELPHRWAARDHAGATAAVAGYDDWGALAHLGVLTTPAQRGRGFAAAAASRAVTEALAAGRLAQWRCRVGNAASARLASRLGFTRCGVQTAVALESRD